MRLLAATASVLLALMLAACGSSSTTTIISTQTATSPSPPTTTTQPAASTAGSTTTVSTTTTSTIAGPRACMAGNLTLSFLGQQGATGHGLLGFALRNTGPGACRTFGYPGILFLGKTGKPLPTEPIHTTHDFFGNAPVVRLVLKPGQTVSFRLGVTHGAVPNEPCTTAYALQVIPPDDTATLRASIADGAYECKTATVSPLRPGTSAYP
jgi:Protein of unknown function (DUF4232)